MKNPSDINGRSMKYKKQKIKLILPILLTFILAIFFSYNFYRLKTEWNRFFQITVHREVQKIQSMVNSTIESGGDPVSSLSSYMEKSDFLKGAKLYLYNRDITIPGSETDENFVEKKIHFKNFSISLYFDTSKEKEINKHIIIQFITGTAISAILITGILVFFRLYFKERETLQKEIYEKDRLKSVSIAISSILHEVKNSLSRLNMIAYRIISTKDSKYAELLQKEIMELSKIIDETASVNKPIKITEGKVNLKNIIVKIVNEFEKILKEKQIKVQIFGEDVKTHGDKKLLESALRNLIKNGIEALEFKKGERDLSISIRKEKDKSVILVEDNANLPIDKENLFLPFKSTKDKGFGLGLFNTKKIIETHKGKISVYKHLGKTVFKIELPL